MDRRDRKESDPRQRGFGSRCSATELLSQVLPYHTSRRTDRGARCAKRSPQESNLRRRGCTTGVGPALGRPTGIEPALTRATTGRSVQLSYSLHAFLAVVWRGVEPRSPGFHPGARPHKLPNQANRKGEAPRPPSGEGRDRTRRLRLARAALSQRELHPQCVAIRPRGGADPERSPATTCLLVLESRVRFELTSYGGKNPAPYQSRHRPQCVVAPWSIVRPSGTARTRTWDRPLMRRMFLPTELGFQSSVCLIVKVGPAGFEPVTLPVISRVLLPA